MIVYFPSGIVRDDKLLRMHDMLLDVLDFHRSERSEAYMQRDFRDFNAVPPERAENFRRKMKARRWRRGPPAP